MTTDEAVLDYIAASDDLEQMATSGALTLTESPYTPVELLGFAAVAKRAAEAEVEDPDPAAVPCGLCGGVRVCDLLWHQARRVNP